MSDRNVEDIYRLSPIQQGMLFHALYEPEGRAYFEQFFYEQPGPLDVELFFEAWRRALARHPILRTGFVWDGLEEPVQVVHQRVELPAVERDLRRLPVGERRRAVEAYLEEDRRAGFDLSKPPLLRVSVLGLEGERHEIVLSYHHLLLDGWSSSLLVREVAQIYEALGRGEEPDLPEPRPFRDFISWLRRQDLEAAGAYWSRVLAGFGGPTPLPGSDVPDGPEAVPGAPSYGQHLRVVPEPVTAALRQVARRHQVTLNTLVQAAWAATLAAYSGNRDVVFGVTVAGRPASLPGVERMLGCFINTLPVRRRIPESGSLGDWLVEIRDDQVELVRFEHSPLAEIRRWAGIAGERTLFDSILVFENFAAATGGGRTVDFQRFQRTNYPLTLIVLPEREMTLEATFRTDRLEDIPVRRMLRHLSAVLERLAADPATVAPLTEPAPVERHALLAEWNDTAEELDRTSRLDQRIAEQAARAPEAVAVVFEGAALSYRELDERSGRLAGRLQELGAGPEVLVGLCAERSLEMVVGLLAILKAGSAYVPLDPGYPAERLAFMLEDARVPVLLTQARLAGGLPGHGARVVLLDPPAGEAVAGAGAALPAPAGPDSLAYAIFTSGSTGRPKGAMNSHRAILNRLDWMQRRYRLDASDRVLQKTPFSFDVSVWELFWPLLVGARLVVARPGGHQDPAHLAGLIAAEGVTTVHFVPSMLQAFVEAPGVDGCTTLRRVIASGEALPRELAERWYRRLAAPLHNLYGPTEAAVDVTAWPVAAGAAGASVPIGRPVANTRIVVLGPEGRPAPVAAPGELHIGGVQVGRGYLSRPALTAERFVPDGPGGSPGGRLYRTGDLARWRFDGALEFLGRLDFQVKVRGFRIELGEIEAAILSHPAVRDAAVLAREQGPGDVRLAAYAVPAGAAGVSLGELREHLARSLPEHMLPSALVLLDALPLTPSGKLDRRALPEPAARGEIDRDGGRGRAYEPPLTPTEEVLAGVWSDLLAVERVGRRDDFFHLGGHSLLATRVAFRARDLLAVEVPLRELFDNPTLAAMAAAFDRARKGGPGGGPPPLVPLPREGEPPWALPLSFAQERLWFLDRLHPGSAAYNIPAAVRLEGELDAGALVAALQGVVGRHEALRTRFGTDGELPVQWVAPASALPVERVDLSSLEPAFRKARAGALVRERARRPFDLAAGPLARALLVTLGPREHLLALTVHHIVSDGWSVAVLVREVAALYAAAAAGREPALEPLPVQYADFAVWQRRWLTGERLAAELDYWRARLAGAPEVLELPLDRPRPPVQTYRGDVASRTVAGAAYRALAALARAEGATPFMVLLSGLAALLGRATGQDDVPVGSPVAGRTSSRVEGLIGLFVNTLVLRTDLAGRPSFRELLGRVRTTVLEAHAHQELPFERLVDELAPRREVSHSPLFQVMLSFLPPAEVVEIPGLVLRPAPAATDTAKFDLTIYGSDRGDELALVAEYNTDLFDRTTIARTLGHLVRLLAAAAEAPATRVADLPLLAPAERLQLAEWNRTETAFGAPALLHRHVALQAARTPDRVALVFEHRHLSYGAVEERVRGLAGRLREAGVGPEELVGVYAERSLELVLGLLAVLEAGGAFVPLDPSYPAERVAAMLEDAAPRAVLAQSRLAPSLPATGHPVILLEEAGAGPAAGDGAGPPMDPDALAYTLFTSGSTGRPKGAMNSHRGVVNRLLWMQAAFPLDAADRVLQKTPASFDVSVWEFFWPLMAGATQVVARPEGHKDPGYLVATVVRERITTLHFVPSMLQELVAARGVEECRSLARVVASGEALPADLVERWYRRSPAPLHNLYGPTEAAVDVTHQPTRPGEPWASVPIGRPVANTAIHVLDPELRQQPVGVAGELCIAGVQVGRGYRARPGLTAERFVPDPLSGRSAPPGARLYRTGDRARWLAAGRLEYLGRLDHQVKVRGFRVELGEIEAALAALAAVREAVVVARGDGGADRRLVAYATPTGAEPLRLSEIRQALAVRLPEYMLPSALVTLERLPLTPSGKVDRRALPEPGEEAVAAAAYAAPRTGTERTLARIWEEVLRRRRVGLDDDFFALGGHSLLATRVASRAEAALGVEVPLMTLFRAPRLGALAAALDELRGRGGAAGEVIARIGRGGPLPLSHAQERLWFLDRFEPGSPLYNLTSALRVRGRLDAGRLAAAVAELGRRHETLRTTFAETAEGAVAVIAAEPSLPVSLVDLGALPEERRDEAERRALRAEARRPFDLARGPLARALLLRRKPERHALLLTLHHIVSDGTSEGVLVRDLLAFYAGGAAAGALPALPVQYADFAAWQRRRLGGGLLAAGVAYWRDRLAGAPPVLALPTDRPRPPVQSFRGAARPARLPPAVAEAVRALARERGATPFMVVLAAYAALLVRYAAQDDVVVGTPVEGRLRPEVEELVGFFVNTLPLRVELGGDLSYGEVLERVRRTTLEAQEHQEVPFEKLVEELAPERSLAHTPLFQVMLVLQATATRPALPPGLDPGLDPDLAAETLPPPTGVSKFDLTLNLFDTGSDLAGQWAYASDLFDGATVGRLAGQLETLLAAACADPGAPASRLPLLTPAERHAVLQEWNDPRVEHPRDGFVHELVAAVAAAAPDRVAVVFAGSAVSYGELERRSGALAERLRRRGAGPEALVGVYAERSPAMVAALLAVLRTGGAYLPLDPELPAERLRFLVADAGLRAVLVTPGLEARAREALGAGGEGGGPELVTAAAEGPASKAPPAVDGGHPAYVLYTSGSTGRPKGVVVCHRALGNRLQYARAADLGPDDSFLQKTTIGFDVSILELFGPLVAGGRTVLPAPGGTQDTAYLVDLIARERVTQTSFPPTLLTALLDEEGFRRLDSLRLVVTGGETVPADLPDRFYRHLPGAVLLNRYGPTETTISVTSWPCPPGARDRVLPIGRPTAATEVYALDRALQPVPVGVPGEVVLGGPGVARGYLARPGRTAAAFVPHPFPAPGRSGERVYRTGDLARLRPDGALEFVGRADDQIKIRGFRVELGEIEATLARQAGVREVAVVARGEGAAKTLAAYAVPEPGAEVDPGALRAAAARALPPYMVPASVTVMAALPLTASGKVDRRALPDPGAPEPAGEAADAEAPRGPVEELVAAVWADLLDRDGIGRRQDFFDLGGHSLLATRVVSRLRQAFGVELPLRRLFEQPTVAGLAREVAGLRAGPAAAAAVPLEPLPRPPGGAAVLPVSFAQERLWFLERLVPGTAAFHMVVHLRLAGRLDVPALAGTLAALAERHETLRSAFTQVGGSPAQRIEPGARLALGVADLSSLPDARRGAALERVARDCALRPLDLGRAPLARVALVRLDVGEHRLLLTLHHAMSDGWSMGVLVREVAALYRALAEGRTPLLEPLPIQYADFAAWQRRALAGEVLARQLAYWRRELAGAPPALELPTDRPRPPVQRYRGSYEPMAFPAPLAAGLRRLARSSGATLFMALLSALDALFARLSGQGDLVVGTPVAGRTRVETEGLIGFFLNNLALRARLEDDPPFRELLARVRETTLGAYAHQDLPFERLVEDLAPERNLSQAPLFQHALVLQNAPSGPLELPGLTLELLDSDTGTTRFDLSLALGEAGGGLAGRMFYNLDLFDRATVKRLVGHLEALVRSAVAAPERRVSELDLLSEAEREELRAWNRTAVARPAGLRLHDLLAEVAGRSPDAVAVSFGTAALSYGELARRSAALALTLRRLGVGPDVLVGVCAERSLELVVALVAVLRAGGAYVPLDPSYPEERLRFMVADAAAPVLLVQERLAGALPAAGARVVLLEDGGAVRGDRADGGAGELPGVPDGPDDPNWGDAALAYVIYTSGSTGRPKGAGNAHRGIVNRLLWMQETFGLDGSDAVLQKTPVSFDVSVWELFWPLAAGARLVMAEPGGHRDPAYLAATIRRERVTTVHFVPSMLQVFLGAPGIAACASLRRVVASGEALPFDLVERCHQLLPAPLHNLYGPTEAAVDVTWWPARPGEERRLVPIGHPVANTRIHLLDPRLEEVPVGVAGELHIGGVQVGRAYHGRPALTAERFLPDPFAAALAGEAGARLYRSGDLARRLPDGAVDFLGRIDHQVKLRGFRIELGEIEAALVDHPAVREAVAVLRRPPAGGGEPRLVAYLVADPAAHPEAGAGAPEPAELRRFLARRLPEHAIPAAFVPLAAMPLNPSGKVDRRALPDPEDEAPAAREPVAPRDAVEAHLAGLWREVLGKERLGVHDDFFALGGSSLAGAVAVNRLQETLGEVVHVVVIFDHPTVAALAGYLRQQHPAAVARLWGGGLAAGAAGEEPAPPVTAEDLEVLVSLIEPLPDHDRSALPRNRPAVFVLAPPRSGTTLLRVMLGGHPALFAPPELELLSFNTLAERRAAFSGRDSFRLEGLTRAVMELLACGPEAAEAAVRELEEAGLTAREAYGRLQQWLGDRVLVDKTPTYAFDPGVLARAEEDFEGARYVHLVRHPYGVVRSFEEAKLDQIFFARPHPFTRRRLAELLWLVSHENILGFLASVPPERWTTVRFEDLVADPEGELRRLCEWLEVAYHPAMADPYADRRSRMTDGLHAESRMIGDVKFHQHRGVDPEVAWRWREAYGEDFLGEPSWKLAERLGYAPAATRAGSWLPLARAERRPGEPAPASFNQERLWFLDRLDPGSSTYLIPVTFRLTGRLEPALLDRAVAALARRHETLRTSVVLAGDRPVQVIAPEPALRLARVDLSGLAAGRRQAEAARVARRARRAPFDLARGPLARVVLVHRAGADHDLTLALHHIVADGWSLGVALRELAALYAAFLRGEGSPLPELPLQYADYAVWQRRWLSGALLERQLAYWRQHLAAIEPLQLPTDRPRPRVQSFRGGSRTRSLPAGLEDRLEALRRSERATPFMVLLAAYAAALARASGQEDFAVGTPVANRSREQTEGLVGLFVNTVGLRLDLSGAPSFRELLARVRRAALGAFAHQEVPFERVVDELRPERSLARSPLFQVLLTMGVEQERGSLELPGLEVTGTFSGAVTAKLDLSVAVVGGVRGAEGRPLLDSATVWMYNRDLFDGTTVERLARHFGALLAAALEEPDRRLPDLPLLGRGERQQLLEWNDTAAPLPAATLDALIRARAEAVPEAVAVSFAAASLTYGELLRRSGLLARRLRALGVGPEALVGIAAERSLELMVGLLGILEAGAAYVPVDPSYPAERRAFMLADSGVRVVLTQERFRDEIAGLAAAGVSVLALDGLGPVAGAPAAAVRAAAPDGAVYAIYTSGSTGKPKGAVNTHRGIVNRLLWMQRTYRLEPGDRVLQKTPVSFDVSVWELFWPLLAGATLVVARPGGHQDPAYLVAAIRDERITTLHFVPSMLQVFLGAPGVEGCASLRRVIASGEALSGELVRRFYRRLPAPLHNLYGPTEAAIDVTFHATSPDAGDSVPIGRPVANTAVHVLDGGLAPVPIGVPGELFLGGVQVARGYHGRPGLTAERFVPDLFAALPGARLYRTGDLARLLADGAVEFLGRLDHQVKVRGFRIELGEIEAALAAQPGVREAVVVARPDRRGETRLTAYLVPAGDLPDGAELRAALAARLPEYMVPSAFVALAELPLNPSGKVDRKRLPEPGEAGAAAARADAGERVPPRTPLEELLASFWSSLLSLDAIGVEEDFFALGGNSLVGAVFINQLQRRLGEIVHVVALFDHPTVAGFADYLARTYPRSVVRLLGAGAHPGIAPEAAETAAEPGVDEAMVAELRRLVPVRRLPLAAGRKNPRAVFVLGPPRSGTTLLRVMLAGHPDLFAPPELELLPYATLAERRDAFPGRDRFRLEGLTRAVMELRGGDAAEAEALLEELADAGTSTPELYGVLQGWLGGRTLVDKTPTYSWYPEALAAAEAWFEEPLYVHLVRHPYGVISSFEDAHLDEIFFRWNHPFSPRQLAELLWVVSHQNVLAFFAGIPEERRLRMDFERLVRDPEAELRRLCSFLGVAYHPAMADPYGDAEGRMTDGVHAESRMLGDVKFHQHRRVDPSVADRWRDRYDRDFLGPVTRRLAAELGLEEARAEAPALPPSLVGLRPGGDRPPLFLVHPLSGEVYFYRSLAAALHPEQPVFGFEAPGLQGDSEPLGSVEELAERYVQSLVAFRSQGPYLLAGSSMGGVVAYEMARRLSERGRPVAFLGLLDAVHPAELDGDKANGLAAVAALLRFLTGGRGMVSKEELEHLGEEERIDLVLERAQGAGGVLPPAFDRARVRRFVALLQANERALASYRPEPHVGRAVFFRAEEKQGGRTRLTEEAWRPLLGGGLELVKVPGAHLTMHFPPHVGVLAGALQRALDEALARESVEACGGGSAEVQTAAAERS
jgi:amino acid adenylation domain-containing protein